MQKKTLKHQLVSQMRLAVSAMHKKYYAKKSTKTKFIALEKSLDRANPLNSQK